MKLKKIIQIFLTIVVVVMLAAEFFTVAEAAPETPILNVPVVVSDTRINLSWSDIADENNFVLYRSFNPDLSDATVFFLVRNTINYTDTNLLPNTLYYYRVFACNTSGCSGSNIENARTQTSGGGGGGGGNL